ncbi:MAG: selenium cofactor biosynthesis protein YqeC [Lachnospiraceae bacterium]
MCRIVAYVGAGGKTSSVLEEAAKLHEMGKRVVVTTTTHMKCPEMCPEGTDQLTECPEEAEHLLQAGEVVWYGHRAAKGGFGGPSREEWSALRRMADVILTEADGSKRLPVKVPAPHEPVIPDYTDRIIIVMGMSGLGRHISEACHRIPLVLDLLNKMENDVLTEEDYAILLSEGYIEPLHRRFPACEMEIYLNQVGTPTLLEAAERIGRAVCQKTEPLPVRYVNYSRALCRTGEMNHDVSNHSK